MTFNAHGDVCLNIFAAVWPQAFDFPPGAHVLEIGCAEADWLTPMHQARPDLTLAGIDWRGCTRPASGAVIHRGDVLTTDFAPESCDAIVFVSSLEHIGLGHYDKDPLAVSGDIEALTRAHQWLKPGGLLYFDVPWNPDPGYEVCGTSHRIYDDATLRDRLQRGLYTERFRGWTTMNDTTQLLPARPTVRNGQFYYCACVWEKA